MFCFQATDPRPRVISPQFLDPRHDPQLLLLGTSSRDDPLQGPLRHRALSQHQFLSAAERHAAPRVSISKSFERGIPLFPVPSPSVLVKRDWVSRGADDTYFFLSFTRVFSQPDPLLSMESDARSAH